MMPEQLGYQICAKCGTQRPEHHLTHGVEVSAAYARWLSEGGTKPELGPVACADSELCRRLAAKPPVEMHGRKP